MCKLMMLLGMNGTDGEAVKRLMQQSIAGEQTLSLETTTFLGAASVEPGAAPHVIARQELQSIGEGARIDKVMLRFTNVSLSTGTAERATIHLTIDDGSQLGSFRRGRVPEQALVKDDTTGESLAFDLTVFKD